VVRESRVLVLRNNLGAVCRNTCLPESHSKSAEEELREVGQVAAPHHPGVHARCFHVRVGDGVTGHTVFPEGVRSFPCRIFGVLSCVTGPRC